MLTEWFPRFLPEYDYPEHLDDGNSLASFYTQNSQFSWLDARALFVLLRAWKPKRIIEVGSRLLLAADRGREPPILRAAESNSPASSPIHASSSNVA